MRKRRRLANKMTIMVCAVLIAVSAFFYAPMETYASETATTETVKETFVFDGTFTHCESGNTSKAAGKTFYLNIGYISSNRRPRHLKIHAEDSVLARQWRWSKKWFSSWLTGKE